MKINVQNLENGILEVNEIVAPGFVGKTYSAYYPDSMDVYVAVDKFGSDYKFKIRLHTTARYQCDRCLADYRIAFRAKRSQIIQIGQGKLSGQNDVVQLPAGTIEAEMDPFLKEMVVLNHPYKMLCRDDCKGICSNCGIDLNKNECQCGSGKIDPRWEELKKFIK